MLVVFDGHCGLAFRGFYRDGAVAKGEGNFIVWCSEFINWLRGGLGGKDNSLRL